MKSVFDFARTYSRSRLGIAGVVLLVIFTSVALLAPFLTPYDPQLSMQLASFRAKPEWLDPSLPRNMFPVSDPGFSSPESIQEWIRYVPSSLTVKWSSSVGYAGVLQVEEGSGPGSILIASSSVSNSTASMRKVFKYESAPPRRFTVSMAYRVVVEGNAQWRIQVLIEQVDGSLLLLWDSKLRADSVGWATPRPAIDTNNVNLRFRLFNDLLADAKRIFSEQGDYTLIINISTITENSTVKVYLDDLNPRIWGEAFGLLGTDNYGRDIFTQLTHGSRISIVIGVLSAIIAVLLGLFVGLTAGYLGGWLDELLMRTNDILLTIPGLPLMIVLSAVIGPSIWSVIILIGFLGWMGIARLIRSQVLSMKTKTFVEASRASGGGTWHIIKKHLIPNVMTMAYTQLALTVPGAIVTEAALSFIGLGDPFQQTWGKMLHDVQYYGAISEWWWALPPGICIALLSMSFVFIGYALDDIFNPKLRRR